MADNSAKKIELNDEQIDAIQKKISVAGKKADVQIPIASTPQNQQQLSSNESQPEESSGEKIVIKSLRTFQGDAAEAIKNQNASVLSIALAEKKKVDEKAKEKPPENPELKKKILTIAASLVFIFLGIGTVVGFYIIQKRAPNTPIVVAPEDRTLIGYKEKITINVSSSDKEKLSSALNTRKQNLALNTGDVAYVALAKTIIENENIISTDDLFAILKTKIPGSALRAFDSQFMFGFIKTNQTEPFIIIKLTSFENAFDGMLQWEPNMYEDLHLIVKKDLIQKQTPVITNNTVAISENSSTSTSAKNAGTSTSKQITSSTTPTVTQVLASEIPVQTRFTDETIQNKDARVLRNNRGEIVLLYSFINKETLLITTDLKVLENINEKITSQSVSR